LLPSPSSSKACSSTLRYRASTASTFSNSAVSAGRALERTLVSGWSSQDLSSRSRTTVRGGMGLRGEGRTPHRSVTLCVCAVVGSSVILRTVVESNTKPNSQQCTTLDGRTHLQQPSSTRESTETRAQSPLFLAPPHAGVLVFRHFGVIPPCQIAPLSSTTLARAGKPPTPDRELHRRCRIDLLTRQSPRGRPSDGRAWKSKSHNRVAPAQLLGRQPSCRGVMFQC
jgi:hypothetical protein